MPQLHITMKYMKLWKYGYKIKEMWWHACKKEYFLETRMSSDKKIAFILMNQNTAESFFYERKGLDFP